ncbi:hypothetical protein EDB44_11229 [Vibrio crassostreae]|uniref:hypothetical protein n=1 Tax=Vibrio crassostreae TaxID=246167 RepID=UPI0010497F37|nr:hypothetical protein [Vibrio crassostreae]TCT60408.1 hypothetical protein EDB44_11229 [Vibrio crassostreae]TCT82140.1 hypothetical protein EDB43_11229 [Vibrio crassostreae]
MTNKLNVNRIWWRNVQPGEFYNIERHHQIAGGGGSLYIEIPGSMVAATLDFLGKTDTDTEFKLLARVIRQPSISGEIEFQWKSKKKERMRIANQNRQQPNSQRHPAWSAAYGFPTAPDGIGCSEDARPFFPDGGVRVYIAETVEGEFYAGYTTGYRPLNMRANDPMWELYSTGVGGVINAGRG